MAGTAATVIVLALALAACGGGTDPSEEVAGTLAREVFTPAYTDAATATATLRRSVESLCERPSPSGLSSARGALAEAGAAWRRTQAMWIGPVMDRRSEGLIDWPANAEAVESALAGGGDITVETVLATSTSARGLGALEHLLHADAERTARRLSAEPRRCAYASAVAAVAAEEAEAVRAAWSDGLAGEPPYAATIAGEGESGLSGEEVVGTVVERQVFLAERISDRELGPSVGSRGAPDPSALVEGAARRGAADIAARLEGIRDAYRPAEDGASLGDLLGERSAGVRNRLVSRLDEAIALALGIGGPLARDLPGRTELAGAVDRVQVALATEVVSALGVTVGFSDNDGDSG